MKNKIVILVGTIGSANGICSIEIAKEFLKNNYEVHIICYDDNNTYDNYCKDNIFFHTVKRTYRDMVRKKGEITHKKKYIYLSKLISLLNYYNYPFLNSNMNRRYYKVVSDLFERENFEMAISIYNPIESIYSIIKMKRKHSFFAVLYTLDTLTNAFRKKTILNMYKYLKNNIYEKMAYKKFDMIINMRCHENHYNSSKYDDFSQKMFLSDIPLLKRNIITKKEIKYFDKKKCNFTYTGSLDVSRRNPTYICNIMNELYSYNKNICLNFFGGGDAQTIINEFCKKNKDAIKSYGIVDHSLIPSIIISSDFMINLEAKNSDMVSAKVFEYMSYNKKIIHFYSSKNDVMLPYLKKYPNSLLIYEGDSLETNINKIIKFMDRESIVNNNIFNIFKENTPEYTCELIINSYNKIGVNNVKKN